MWIDEVVTLTRTLLAKRQPIDPVLLNQLGRDADGAHLVKDGP